MLIHIFYESGMTTTRRINSEQEYQEIMAMMQLHCVYPIPGILLIETTDSMGLNSSSEVMKARMGGQELAPHPPLSI